MRDRQTAPRRRSDGDLGGRRRYDKPVHKARGRQPADQVLQGAPAAEKAAASQQAIPDGLRRSVWCRRRSGWNHDPASAFLGSMRSSRLFGTSGLCIGASRRKRSERAESVSDQIPTGLVIAPPCEEWRIASRWMLSLAGVAGPRARGRRGKPCPSPRRGEVR